jgi:hypothetical protein
MRAARAAAASTNHRPGGFEPNAYYERLLELHQRGKVDIKLLSMPTQLALAAYTKQKRLHEALHADIAND